MIATILPSSSCFHAVQYNEHKREIGSAELIEAHNIPASLLNNQSAEGLQQFFIDYSNRNDRVEKPQFHVAISCKGQEMTNDELLEFAHKWLCDMGYDNNGQPWLIYAHRDTDNNHIHIITSRINPFGKKIDHNHERRRSQKVIDKILRINPDESAKKDLENALSYRFEDNVQFRAIMESMGYKAFFKKDKLYFTKGGGIRINIPLRDVFSAVNDTKPEMTELAQLRAFFNKYHLLSCNRTEFQNYLKTNFGISLVFYGTKDKPYGYAVVDHANKKVYKGNRIMPIGRLLDFMPLEKRIERLDEFIHDSIMANPSLSLKRLRRLLWQRFGARIEKDAICIGERSIPLNRQYLELLKSNDRAEWARQFILTTESERALLSHIAKVDASKIGVYESNEQKDLRISFYKSILAEGGYDLLVNHLDASGFKIFKYGQTRIAINFKTCEIVDLALCGLTFPKKIRQEKDHKPGRNIRIGDGRVERGQKRDWEIEEGTDYRPEMKP